MSNTLLGHYLPMDKTDKAWEAVEGAQHELDDLHAQEIVELRALLEKSRAEADFLRGENERLQRIKQKKHPLT